MAAYTTIDNPELWFQAKAFIGNAGTLAVTLDGSEDMSPNLVITKPRETSSYGHKVWDTVRGVTDYLETNSNGAEGTGLSGLDSFDSNGFTLGSYAGANPSSAGVVAWCWKAGTSFSNDASATGVGDIDSSGSVSQTAGFSICIYSGSGTSGHTIKHGLNTAPKIIIIKKRSASDNWTMLNTNISLNTHLHLNNNDAAVSDPMFNNTAPTTSVFTVDSDGQVNESGHTFIAYCFSEVQGFSKFGSYTGNGNADGTFVYTGFRPAFVITKRTNSTSNWHLDDNKRDTFNVTDKRLFPDLSDAESTGASRDFLSNGFKIRNTYGGQNGSGDTYIYLAFAESSFVNSSGVPNNGR